VTTTLSQSQPSLSHDDDEVLTVTLKFSFESDLFWIARRKLSMSSTTTMIIAGSAGPPDLTSSPII
jgi:hypothetical protein